MCGKYFHVKTSSYKGEEFVHNLSEKVRGSSKFGGKKSDKHDANTLGPF